MRELKFRAWNGRAMEYGGFSIHASNGKLIPSDITNVGEGAPVMQYTGLKDSEGKEIYEGDIVAVKPSLPKKGHKFNAEIIYSDRFTEFVVSGTGYSVGSHPSKLVVIGNIHETPELIE